MHFEWDEHKDALNRTKHGVSFETARLVFDDPLHLSIQDRTVASEERWQTIGLVAGVVIMIVAHTFRENDSGIEVIRIISARKATASERRRYEQGF